MGPPYIGPPQEPSCFDRLGSSGTEGLVVTLAVGMTLFVCVMFLPMIFGWV